MERRTPAAPDRIFSDPRLAAVYDELDIDRRDLDHYEAIVDELGARRVVDIGCGTGLFACRLAQRGLSVTGVDPAAASLDVARDRPGGELVAWRCRHAAHAPVVGADLATMTGNVAQVFLSDHDWRAALAGVRRALRPGGHFVFESRDPSYEGWRDWTREASWRSTETHAGTIESWVELTEVELPFVSFRWTYRFVATAEELVSDSTLRFRSADELVTTLAGAAFSVEDVRDAPDRPGRELVVIARSTGSSRSPSSAEDSGDG
jgi:SAM-dependent methyltransferase